MVFGLAIFLEKTSISAKKGPVFGVTTVSISVIGQANTYLVQNRKLFKRSNPTNHGQCNRFISISTALLWKSMKKYVEQ